MAPTDDTEALTLAYVYGELSASAALAFERRMDAATAEGAELRAEVEGLRASRALFGRDAHFGVASGIDLPPSHLVDAIMNAEAIARPPELRRAALVARTPEAGGFTARLSRWLLGGGLALGAAAALFVVVTNTRSDEQLISVAASAPPAMDAMDSEATRAPVVGAAQPAEAAPEPQPEAPVATGGSVGPRDEGAFGGLAAAKLEAGHDQGALDRRAFADAKPSDASDASEKRADKPSKKSRESEADDRVAPARDPQGAKDASPPLVDGYAESKAKGEERSFKEAPRKADAPALEFERARAPGGASLGLSSNSAGPVALPVTTSAAPPPPAAPAPVKATPAPAPKAVAKAPTSPRPDGSNALSDDLSDDGDELSVISRAELQKRRAVGRESRDKADRGKSSMGADADRAHRLEQSNMALASAEREAKAKRWLPALDQYANAEVLDHDRALGATPLVGQMRALVALKRPVDAAKVARRLGRWDVKSFDVPAGLLLGAQVAEQIGDERLARELWSRLLDVPADKAKARAALERLDRSQVLRQHPMQMDSDAAASEAPAAASESTKQ